MERISKSPGRAVAQGEGERKAVVEIGAEDGSGVDAGRVDDEDGGGGGCALKARNF